MIVNEDRRIRMTKKILKEALIEIMRTKPINEISIKKICDTADVNRSTFYHHYQSPEDLFDDIINDITADILIILEKSKETGVVSVEVLTKMLEYIESKRGLFLVLLSTNGSIGIGERLNSIIGRFIGADNDSEIAVYCAQFISAGLANILWLWLNNETRMSPRDFAELLTTIMTHGVRRAVMFSDIKNKREFC